MKNKKYEQLLANQIKRVVILRMWNKLTNIFKAQGMPKYQNLYIGGGGGKVRVKNGGGVVVLLNCYYESNLASYVYWCDANGVMVLIAERNLEAI